MYHLFESGQSIFPLSLPSFKSLADCLKSALFDPRDGHQTLTTCICKSSSATVRRWTWLSTEHWKLKWNNVYSPMAGSLCPFTWTENQLKRSSLSVPLLRIDLNFSISALIHSRGHELLGEGICHELIVYSSGTWVASKGQFWIELCEWSRILNGKSKNYGQLTGSSILTLVCVGI